MRDVTLFRKEVRQQCPNRKEGMAVIGIFMHSVQMANPALSPISIDLLFGDLITEVSCLIPDEKSGEPYFGRKYDSATNCHTSFRNCQSSCKSAERRALVKRTHGHAMCRVKFEVKEEDQGCTLLHASMRPLYGSVSLN